MVRKKMKNKNEDFHYLSENAIAVILGKIKKIAPWTF